MRIPQIDLAPQHEELKSELLAEMETVLDSGAFILGPTVEKCEQQVAEFIGVGHGIGCNSGTDALILALLALDIGPGDEVITTPFSFFASGGAIARVGATPVFVDVEEDYYTIDPRIVANAITTHTRAIIPVHIFGQPAEMDQITAIARQHDLFIIEDAAQSIGANWKNNPTGSLGDLACLSFYPTKNLSALGDAGMVVTEDETLARRLRSLRSHGEQPKYHHHELGMNSRLGAFNAAAISLKLKRLEQWNNDRRQIAAIYDRGLDALDLPAEVLQRPHVRPGASHSYHQYSLRVSQRDELKDYLAEHGIGTAIHYPGVIYQQPCFQQQYEAGLCPVAERLTRHILSLPMYPQLPHDDAAEVVERIGEFYTS